MHFIITIAGVGIDSLLAWQLDDDLIYPSQLDANGLVTTGKYKDKVQLQIDLGTAGPAFVDLDTATTEWTTSHKQAG